MKRKLFTTLATLLAALALVACLACLAACGGPRTLEEYAEANPDEWSQVESTVTANSTGEYSSIQLTVEDNKISQVLVFANTYSDEELQTMKGYFEEQSETIQEQVRKLVANVQEATGIEGVTWYFEYQNGDGTVIWSATVGAAAQEADTAESAESAESAE